MGSGPYGCRSPLLHWPLAASQLAIHMVCTGAGTAGWELSATAAPPSAGGGSGWWAPRPCKRRACATTRLRLLLMHRQHICLASPQTASRWHRPSKYAPRRRGRGQSRASPSRPPRAAPPGPQAAPALPAAPAAAWLAVCMPIATEEGDGRVHGRSRGQPACRLRPAAGGGGGGGCGSGRVSPCWRAAMLLQP